MIATEFYDGQGLGNQLWCYIVTRVIAADRGYDFGMKSPEKFKGLDFMNIDMGKRVDGGTGPVGGPPTSLPAGITNYYAEKRLIHPLNGSDIRMHDQDLLKISDNTKIDGYMQDEQYIAHRKDEIREWLRVRPEFDCRDYSSDDICVINFRGTGYVQDKDFFLSQTYWKHAIAHMRSINPHFKFVVITEDVKNARTFFPEFEVHHFTIGKDYSCIKNARYLILSNSSFAWFPAWLSEDLKYCIAPKYWSRHNISDGYWSLGYAATSGWMYQDRNGDLQDYQSCLREVDEYVRTHEDIVSGKISYRPGFATQIKNMQGIFRAWTNESNLASALYKAIGFFTLKAWVSIRRMIWKVSYLHIKRARKIARMTIEWAENARFNIQWAIREYRAKLSWLSRKEIMLYRKKIKIYDVFNFFNELEVLEIRLNILNDYVDHFVIVESRLTHSGLPKKLYFEENKHLFEKFSKKIIHFVIERPLKDYEDARERLKDPTISELERFTIEGALNCTYIGPGLTAFLRDYYEKEAMKKPLVGIADNDFCFISDLDEIWDPNVLIDYSQDSIYKIRQRGYIYYLNNRTAQVDWRGWSGTMGTKYKNIKNASINDIRRHSLMNKKFIYLKNAGWHFSFQGGAEKIKTKIDSYSHHELRNSGVKSRVEEMMSKNQDVRGNDYKMWVDESDLPKYLLDNKDKYRSMFK